ncbi:TPA: amino acid ABC transporter permease [Klebsiella pneumoniae]|nr:amino acid ABC transporter permease [Klebsiella pneumoniae]
MFDISVVFPYFPQLLIGVLSTLAVSLSAIVTGLILGWLICLGLNSQQRLVRCFCKIYVSFYRGTPLLVQLFLVFYGGPYIGINLEAQQVGVLCLGCYGSAYFSEIFRAGRNAVSGGQSEAAADLGLSPWQIFTFIVWPQMFARIIQPLIGQSVILVKESSVLSIITVGELTNTAMAIANQTYAMVEIYSLMAIVYWGIAIGISRLGNKIERHYSYSQLSRG